MPFCPASTLAEGFLRTASAPCLRNRAKTTASTLATIHSKPQSRLAHPKNRPQRQIGPIHAIGEICGLAPCIIIGRKGSYGKLNYSCDPVFAVDTTFILDQRHTFADLRFLYYLLSILGLDELSDDTAIPGLSKEKAYQALSPLPPLATQRRIARFLDKKTARIDGLIEKKRALLYLLAEKRQALITCAVTKGLEPDGRITPEQSGGARVFDADGGISYFAHGNELPERVAHILKRDWDSSWLKWSVDLSTNRPTEEEQETLPYISNESIESWTGELLVKEPEPESAGAADGRMFKKNDVLFNKLRPYLAKVHHATFDGVSSGELLCLRPTHAVEPRFLFYALLSKGFIDKVNAETFGAKMPRADWEIVGHQPLPLPSLATQRKIARFLDEKTAQIDELHGLIVQSVNKLAEYRSALITAAVTGQLAELQ